MSAKLVECYSHGKSKPAFVCRHLLEEKNVGWNEPEFYSINKDDDFAGCINAWCNKCEVFAIQGGGWNDETEAFADIKLICENCALKFKEANLK